MDLSWLLNLLLAKLRVPFLRAIGLLVVRLLYLAQVEVDLRAGDRNGSPLVEGQPRSLNSLQLSLEKILRNLVEILEITVVPLVVLGFYGFRFRQQIGLLWLI